MAKGKAAKREKEKRKKEEDEKRQKSQETQASTQAQTKKEPHSENLLDFGISNLKVLKGQQEQHKETNAKIYLLKLDIDNMRHDKWNLKIWNEYMSCDAKPNLEEPTQLNAYLSLWMENDEELPDNIMLQCDNAVKLLFDVENCFYEARHLPQKVKSAIEQVFQDLNQSIIYKIDKATLKILQRANLFINQETGNSYYEVNNMTVKLGVWSNLACNPRYNGVDVINLGVTFNAPRTVITSECAVRIMIMENTLHSLASPKYAPLNSPLFGVDEKIDAPTTSKSLPKLDSVEDGFVDNTQYIVTGPVLSIHLLSIPSQPHFVTNGWVMTKVDNSSIIGHLPWSCDSSTVLSDVDESSRKEDDESENEPSQNTGEHKKILQITWRLPEDLLWFDIPKLVSWKVEEKIWSTQECHNVNYKEDNSQISFCASSFGMFAVLLPRFASLPYQNWEISHRGCEDAVFSLTTLTAAVEIAIRGGMCSILQIQSNEKLYSQSSYGIEDTPPQILKRIQSVGVFLTPGQHDHLLTNHIKEKNASLETKIYCQIAMMAKVASFAYSRWNLQAGIDKFVLQLPGKNSKPDNGGTNIVLITQERATLLSISEVSQNFSEGASVNDPANADLYHLVQHLSEEDARHAMNTQCDVEFIDCIYQLLASTRVLCC